MFRLSSLLIVFFLFVPFLSPILAQPTSEPNGKQSLAIQKIQNLLEETLIDSKPFQTAMPLSKFLDSLEKQLAVAKIAVRLDKEAIGDQFAEVAATPISLPAAPKKTSLRAALQTVMTKIKVKTDYRIDPTGVTITTPKRSLFSMTYDIQQLIAKPNVQGLPGPKSKMPADPAKKAAYLVQALYSSMSLMNGKSVSGDLETVEVLNATQLVIRTTGSRHAEFRDLLQAFHRLADVAVFVQARLYEVDEPFYTKVKNAKHIPLEELEKQFLEGNPPKDELFEHLKKVKPVLIGPDIKLDDAQEGNFLSWQKAVFGLPSPQQWKKGDKGAQAILEGVSFRGQIKVSPDRRSVLLKLSENATELERFQKINLGPQVFLGDVFPAAEKEKLKKEMEVFADIPFLKKTTQTRVLEIPDGGSILTPVLYRPPSAQARGKWWVLSVTARIWIEEEEKLIFLDSMEAILPGLLEDVLKNPKLKAAREMWGSPGDTRFALVDSPAWTWPENFLPAVGGFQRAKADPKGKRLLGVRIDKQQEIIKKDRNDLSLTVSLVNAGGNANGAVVGSCTLHYMATWKGGRLKVELAETPGS